MFCKNCGNQLPDGAMFCGGCGTKVEAPAAPQQPAYEAPQQPAYAAPQQPAYVAPQSAQAAPKANNPALDELAGSVMSKGITGLVLSLILGLPGVFVSASAKRMASDYARQAGELSGKAKVGSILAKVGFPVGFAMTGFYVLYAIILMASMA